MINRLRADSCCSFDDFTTLLKSLVESVLTGTTFIEAFPEGTNPESINSPLITYKVCKRVPAVNEIKPRIRETSIGADPDDIEITYGQRFDYYVEFGIWGQNNEEANKIMNAFEDLIAIYIGDLMRNGVQQMLFVEQGQDNKATQWRADLSNRTLMYRVRLERQVISTSKKLKLITVRVNNGELVFTIQQND